VITSQLLCAKNIQLQLPLAKYELKLHISIDCENENIASRYVGMIPYEVPGQTFLWALENSSQTFSSHIQQPFAFFNASQIPRINRADFLIRVPRINRAEFHASIEMNSVHHRGIPRISRAECHALSIEFHASIDNSMHQ